VENTITVYRYLRPHRFYWVESDEHFIKNNLYGITIRFDINHEIGEVIASWAVCDGENFSREVGKSYADMGIASLAFDYSLVDGYQGLTNALVNELSVRFPKYAVGLFTDFGTKIKLFKKATREI
jgi:hypothetical protein